jgi:acetoin utilization deacetylase AcuC-like enzyme
MLRVFFSDKLVAAFATDSPSPRKPRLVVQDWIARGLPVEIVAPDPVTEEDFALAHDPVHVREILSLQKDNGFFTRDQVVVDSLFHTTGAMVAAAVYAAESRSCACAPVSGFHHAMYRSIGVYCTFNGLIVAAQLLKKRGLATKVGILDYDMHYGDGTEDIREELRLDHVVHVTAGKAFRKPEQAEGFLRSIPEHLERMRGCDVVLYQAGADPHVKDPLGGFLTTEQLRLRDRAVFVTARAMGLPVAWDLAGGYQEEKDGSIPALLEIHRNTAVECIEAFSR